MRNRPYQVLKCSRLLTGASVQRFLIVILPKSSYVPADLNKQIKTDTSLL